MASKGIAVDTLDVLRTLYAIVALQGSSVAVAAPGMHKPRAEHREAKGKDAKDYARKASTARKSIPIATLVRWHEYGTEKYNVNFPQRPFIRNTIQNKRDEIDKTIAGVIRKLIGSKGRWGGAKAHDLVGRRVVAELRRTLAARVPPPLSPATMADPDRDKRGIPLVDTGQIRDSLTWRSEGL